MRQIRLIADLIRAGVAPELVARVADVFEIVSIYEESLTESQRAMIATKWLEKNREEKREEKREENRRRYDRFKAQKERNLERSA